MIELAIIADDLTGALDSAAPFAMRGLKTVVALGPDGLDEAIASGATVVGVSTDSRDGDAAEAGAKVRGALDQLPSGVRYFKKIDSRLKGHLQAELDAFDYRQSLVVPAIPAFDRWIRDGALGGFGVDLPIDIAERLGAHAGRAIIPDTVTQKEIDNAFAGFKGDLLVGARALAEAVAARMGKADGGSGQERFGSIVFIIGSTDPITLAQIEALLQAHPEIAYVAAQGGVRPERMASSEITMVQATPDGSAIAPDVVAARLAATVEPLVTDDALLVISGGATAQVVLGHFKIGAVQVMGEALPGLPLADTGRFKLITKSGGFGARDVFCDVLDRFVICAGKGGV